MNCNTVYSIRYSLRLILSFLTATALISCASYRVTDSEWPADLPTRSVFIKVYENDDGNKQLQTQDEYLTWILRFYKGWELNPRGWINITEELLLELKNQSSANEVKTKINQLGVLISGEWSKNNSIRKINTKHISLWANTLIKSLAKNETLQLIDHVLADVKGLLNGEIAVNAITLERYNYSEDQDPLN